MEELPLPLHLFIHLLLAVCAGYAVGRSFKKPWLGILAGVAGGFFIDLDHVLEYFLVFGPHFNLVQFLDGQQFLASGQVRSYFHAWEYLPVLGLAGWLLRRKHPAAATIILSLALGAFVHLVTDCVVNSYPPRNYSMIYKYRIGFRVENFLSPEQYREFQESRAYLGF